MRMVAEQESRVERIGKHPTLNIEQPISRSAGLLTRGVGWLSQIRAGSETGAPIEARSTSHCFANPLRFNPNTSPTNPAINPAPIKFSSRLGGNTSTKSASLMSAAKLDTQNGIR